MRSGPPAVLASIAIALALASGSTLRAADGALDATFGNGGALEIGWNYGGNDDDFVKDIAADDNGNLYAVGYLTSETTDYDWGVAKVQASGDVLQTRLYWDAGGTNNDEATAVMLDGPGAILVAGSVDTANSTDLRLCRFSTANLSLDAAFGSGGCASYGLGPSEYFHPRALAHASNGEILLGGTIVQPGTNNPNPDFFVMEFATNGAVDGNFGFFGIRVVPFDSTLDGDDEFAGMAVDHQGRILLTGSIQWTANSTYTKAGVARLSPAGNLDTGFGNSGKFLFDVYPNEQAEGLAIAVDPFADSFEVSGAYNPSASQWTAYLYFFDANGGATAFALMNWNDAEHTDYARKILRQCDGKILVAGDGKVGETWFGSRLLADGSGLDGTYNGTGDAAYTPYHLGFYLGRGTSSAALSDGRLVVAGDMYWGNRDWLLVRFTSDLMFCDGFESDGTGAWSFVAH